MKTIQTPTSKSRAMLPKRLVAMLRMVLGYTLGIIGFSTLSLGFVHLSGTQILVGLAEVAVATAATLGLMVPLREKRAPASPHRDG